MQPWEFLISIYIALHLHLNIFSLKTVNTLWPAFFFANQEKNSDHTYIFKTMHSLKPLDAFMLRVQLSQFTAVLGNVSCKTLC